MPSGRHCPCPKPTVPQPLLVQADSAERRRVVSLVVFKERSMSPGTFLLKWTLFKRKVNGDQAGVLLFFKRHIPVCSCDSQPIELLGYFKPACCYMQRTEVSQTISVGRSALGPKKWRRRVARHKFNLVSIHSDSFIQHCTLKQMT